MGARAFDLSVRSASMSRARSGEAGALVVSRGPRRGASARKALWVYWPARRGHRAHASYSHSAGQRKTTTSPIRAQPEGRARSDKTEGEVGGAQRAQRASTDGCQRLTSSCYEGAGAEREGFEPCGRRWQYLQAARDLAPQRSEIWCEMARIALSAGGRESSGVGQGLGSGCAARSRPRAMQVAVWPGRIRRP